MTDSLNRYYRGSLLVMLALFLVGGRVGNANCPTKSNNPVHLAPNTTYYYCFDSTISNYVGMGLTINDAITALNQAIPSNTGISVAPADTNNPCTWLWRADPGLDPLVPGALARVHSEIDRPDGYSAYLTTTFWLGNSGWDTGGADFETAIFKFRFTKKLTR